MEGTFSQVSPLKFQDNERTITGMTPFNRSKDREYSFSSSQINLPSTPSLEAALLDLPKQQYYRLKSQILRHTNLTECMRARLRTFLMIQCSKQFIYRQVCVLACTYIDLYLLKLGQVPIKQFQNLAIACLIIATKSRQNIFPNISFEVFKRDQILDYERKIAFKLNFRLNPITYYDYTQRIVYLWDNYIEQRKQYNLKFTEQLQGSNWKLRKLYQQLDVAFMVLKTLDLEMEQFVANFFYLHARMFNVYEVYEPSKLSSQEFANVFYPKDDIFLRFYSEFMNYYSKEPIKIDPSYGNKIKIFLDIPRSKKEWIIQDKSSYYEHVRQWDELQTLPLDCYSTAKALIGQNLILA